MSALVRPPRFPRPTFFLNEISEKSCSAAVALIVRQSVDFADYYLKKVPKIVRHPLVVLIYEKAHVCLCEQTTDHLQHDLTRPSVMPFVCAFVF
jgi:hypothetical protein